MIIRLNQTAMNSARYFARDFVEQKATNQNTCYVQLKFRVPFGILSDDIDDDKSIDEPEGIDESQSSSNLRYGTGGRRHYRPRHHHRNHWVNEDTLEPLNGKEIIGHNDGIDEEIHDASFHPAGAKIHAEFPCISHAHGVSHETEFFFALILVPVIQSLDNTIHTGQIIIHCPLQKRDRTGTSFLY